MTWGAQSAHSFMPTESIWDGPFLHPSQSYFRDNNPRKAKWAKEVAGRFGDAFYECRPWEEDEVSEFILTKDYRVWRRILTSMSVDICK